MRWSQLLASCTLIAACNDPVPADYGTAIALSVDARGLPGMLHARGLPLAHGVSPGESARIHATRLAPHWGVLPSALPVLDEVGTIRVPGGTVVRLRQVIDGLPIYREELRMLVRDTGELVAASGTLVGTHTPRLRARFVDDAAGAIDRAVTRAHGSRTGARVDDARARQVWYPHAGGLVAAWVVEVYTSDPNATSGDLHRTVVAHDGRVLAHESLVADAAFSYRVFADSTGERHPLDGPIGDATPHPTGVPDGSYPAYIEPSLVVVDSLNALGDPWLAIDAGETSGNNVDAYADLSAPTGLGSGDFRAKAIGQAFDYTYDTSQGPLVSTEQQMAGITSLFYVINWLHDFWYDAGFTETAGNAQASNYERGGLDGDVLLAEAQDGAGTLGGGPRNNANMSTPDDGMSPRMQVYLWNGRDTRTMTLQPSGRMPTIGGAVYGPRDFTITGDIVVADDGAGANPTDGCTAFTNDVAGKLVLVDRGNCTFKTKTLNTQNAGGIGTIIANNVSSTTPPFLGDDANLPATTTIPSVSVTQDEGAAIKQELAAAAVTAEVHREVAPELDGALDATLIAHEFGHYLHHRLSFCTTVMCRAVSEGWGDFVALMLLARAGDDLTGAFPFSVYTTQSFANDSAYFGIRRAPYSVDFAINALSFRHMADGEPLPTHHPMVPSNLNSEIHNAGEIWASALWEVYVALQQAGSSFDEVRAKMARYVVTGLLMVPTNASPMETRDALLAAALAADPADHAIMIEAFARRGFGSCAIAPPPSSVDFVGLVESTIVAGNPQLAQLALTDGCDEDGVLDAGETVRVTARVANQGHAPLTDVTFTIDSQLAGVTVLSPPIELARLEPFATTDLEIDVALAANMTGAIAGDLALHVTANGGCETTAKLPVAFRLNVDDVPSSSTVDTFDTAESLWQPWSAAWSHVRETPLDGQWHGTALAAASDTRLTSPFLVADETKPLVMTFTHRHKFEHDRGVAWDGGVIEVSVDNGVTWVDASTVAATGYNGTVGNESGNVLADRLAYVATNPSWPDPDPVTVDFGTALAGHTFQVRFRIGTDAGTGDYGWDLDDVAFEGILGTPFSSQVSDDGNCEPVTPIDDPIVSGGGGCCQGGRASNGVLALIVLAMVRRRRARSTRRA